MSIDDDIHNLGAGPPDEIAALAERLHRERPVPSAAFRGDLRRRLVAGATPPARLAPMRRQIAGYAVAGSLLLFVGAMSVVGFGPLGA